MLNIVRPIQQSRRVYKAINAYMNTNAITTVTPQTPWESFQVTTLVTISLDCDPMSGSLITTSWIWMVVGVKIKLRLAQMAQRPVRMKTRIFILRTIFTSSLKLVLPRNTDHHNDLILKAGKMRSQPSLPA